MITRPNIRESRSLAADFVVLIFLVGLLFEFVQIQRHWHAPLQSQAEIDLRFSALPGYLFFSLSRGFIAYGFSLMFAVLYGYAAAHSTRAERVMVPLLDILQSIPVLGFLPGTVLGLVTLFPHSNIGLELASILMIFTGQVWNMTFSFYQSVRSIPSELREAASLYQFSKWQRFCYVELPASATGLAWNSMMSMAGGWFFLMVCEAFQLGDHDFRLPGLGAYMSVALAQRNLSAIAAGIVAMILMIVVVNACLWEPVLEWTQRFRLEEISAGKGGHSLVAGWISRSRLFGKIWLLAFHPWLNRLFSRLERFGHKPGIPIAPLFKKILIRLLLVAGAGIVVWASIRMGRALIHVSKGEWLHLAVAAAQSFIRVFLAVILGSLWTIPVGIWIGRSERRSRKFQPLVQIAASFPAPMLYPLVLLVLNRLGIGLNWGAVVLMLLGTQWYILFNVIAGASSVPPELREVLRAYRFTSVQAWRSVWLPAVSPYLITGWVTAAGGAWNASIVAEYVSLGKKTFVAAGLGSSISMAASQGRYDLLAAAVLVMAALVVLINRYFWKPLYRFVETRYAY